jgi:hypothetical protein
MALNKEYKILPLSYLWASKEKDDVFRDNHIYAYHAVKQSDFLTYTKNEMLKNDL